MVIMICSLQSELDACKNSPEEQICQELGKELSDLQRKCYHKQMKLQTARQNRMAAPQTSTRSAEYHYTTQHLPLPEKPPLNDHSEFYDEIEVIDLVEDDWLEAGALDNFDSNDDADDNDVLMESEWDIDEVENQSEYIQEEKSTLSRQKSFPPASFIPQRSTRNYSVSAAMTDFQTVSLSGNTSSTGGKQGQGDRIPLTKTAQPHTKTPRGSQLFTTPREPQPPRGTQPQTRNPRGSRPQTRNPEGVSSPFVSNISRKRPGESIFKAPKVQNQR